MRSAVCSVNASLAVDTAGSAALMIRGRKRYLDGPSEGTLSSMDAATDPRPYFPSSNRSAVAASLTPHAP